MIGSRVLIVVDQFEELFSFRRNEGESGAGAGRFASRDDSATFVRLLLRACAEPSGRIAVIITMRSDFIGDCDAFLDLPELVSRSQFLVPRLNRGQMREAIERPGQIGDLGYAPFVFEEGLVDRIIADAGDRLDQLPLMQHALMRTWKMAGGPEALAKGQIGITAGDYRTAGRIAEALSKHADDAWLAIKEDSKKANLTRRLFLLLSDVHADGKIVRRRPLLSEVQAVTGADIPAIEEIVRLFQSDDRNFLLPPLKPNEHLTATDYVDISHEALLRQWKEFGTWLIQEAEWKIWLQELSQAAKDYEKDQNTEPWKGNDLRGAEEWLQEAQPSAAWARRHGVQNWEACLAFLARSRDEAARLEALSRQAHEEKERLNFEAAESKRKAAEEKLRNQKRWQKAIGAVAAACFILGLVVAAQWKKKSAQQQDVIQVLGPAAGAMAETGKTAIADAEQRAGELAAAIQHAATEPPPDQAETDTLLRALNAAKDATESIAALAKVISQAAKTTEDGNLTLLAISLEGQAEDSRKRRQALSRDPETFKKVQRAIEARITRAEQSLEGLLGKEPLNPALVQQKDEGIDSATADLAAIGAIEKAAFAFGFEGDDYKPFSERIDVVNKTLTAADKAREISTSSIVVWKPDSAVVLKHEGKVNRVRFAPAVFDSKPLIAAGGEDKKISFWRSTGQLLGAVSTSSAINDVAFSPRGDAIAAGNGSTVRVWRWKGLLNLDSLTAQSFDKHSDSVTDVEFSHGGERIVSVSVDRTVRVFDARSMAQLYFTSPALPAPVTAAGFHRADNLVVSGCDDGGVRLHTIDQPSVRLLGQFNARARRPEFSYDGKLVIAASDDKTARVWPIVGSQEIVRIQHGAVVTQATFRPVIDAQGYTFVTTANNGEVRSVRFTDLTTKSAEYPGKLLEPHHPGPVQSATWSGDGRWLATVGAGEVLVWEWITDAPVAHLQLTGLHPETSRAEFSPDAKLLVTYGGDNLAHVWDLTKLPSR
jgi:WD40 repeat protein